MKNQNIYKIIIGCCIAIASACAPSNNQQDKNLVSKNEESIHLGNSQSNYIVNGEPVKSEDPIAKSTVALYIASKKTEGSLQSICTGTLIAKNVILTAGHCIKDVSEVFLKIPMSELISRLRIGFGLPRVTNDSNDQVSFVKVKKVLVHPEYESEMVRKAKKVPMPDLSLILMEADAPANFEPVAFGTDVNIIQEGLNITLAGYGYTSGTNFTLPTQLMKVDVNISEPKMTSAQFSYKSINGKSACMGDSGGPAYIQNTNGELLLVGVTSWGDNSCSKYGVYTNVPAFSEFITTSLETLQQSN